MKTKPFLKALLIFSIIAASVACDQISKSIVRQKINYNEQIIVINNFVTLTKTENTGAFLGLGDNLPWLSYMLLMIILPLLLVGFALYYVFKSSALTKLAIVAICLIAGGGLGNIIDRILYSSVTDFLYFDFKLFHTGIVNLADISVTAGFLLLVYEYFFAKKKTAPSPAE